MQEKEQEFSFKRLFVPLTTLKAIHIIIIVGFLVFGNMLFNGFVWDDIGYILTNPDVINPNISKIFSASAFNSSGYYRPISAAYFTLMHSLFGSQAIFYHFVQMALHITNVCLLFYLLQKFFSKTIALLFSLVFLVHPIQVESVAYIGATQSELFFFFGMVGLLISMKESFTKKHVFLTSGFLLLSLLTKELGFLFLFTTIIFHYFFKRKRVFFLLPYLLLTTTIYFFIRFVFGGISFEKIFFVPIARLSFIERLMNIPEIIFYYLKTFFYPAKLSIEQHWIVTTVDVQHFYVPLLVDIVFFLSIIVTGYFLYKHSLKLFWIFLFFGIWFVIGIAMLLQIFPLDMTVADRWFYFPLVGLLGMIGVIVTSLKFNQKSMQVVFFSILILSIVLFSIRSIIRNTNWFDNLTLYTHDTRIHTNFDLENNFGVQFMNAGDAKQAIEHFQKSVAMYSYDNNLSNLGVSYVRLGDSKKAKEYFIESIVSKTHNPKGHKHDNGTWYNLVYYLVSHDDLITAKKYLQEALQDYPEDMKFLQLLAITEYKVGNREQALTFAQRAYTRYPNAETNYVYQQILDNQPIIMTKQ